MTAMVPGIPASEGSPFIGRKVVVRRMEADAGNRLAAQVR
jgi:hypothetical protein